ncbi:F-box/kelch-repeat protein [Trifolium repens]|nr:F-box/kelch-repeat protein [Trifolium repens]
MAAANEMVSKYMPDEITVSILSKLPLKSLKRFECVHKSWSLLFENHYFMNKFRNNFLSYNNDPSSLILKGYKRGKEVFFSSSGERFENKVQLDWSSSFQNRFRTTDILGSGSVNGTLCFYGSYGDIVLWNPATQAIKPLPDSKSQFIEGSIPDEDEDEALGYPYVAVAFYEHGFGYDPVTNDYKVIRFVNIHLERYDDTDDDIVTLDPSSYKGLDLDPFWEIYSLKSNSWRKLHVDKPHSCFCSRGTGVCMDGVCHWVCKDNRPCLVSFYLSNEKFFVTLIPSDVDDSFVDTSTWIKLAVLNGSITLISYHENTTTFHISILGEFGLEESWTKLLIVGPLSCVERPIGVGMKGEIVFIRKDNELVWLDLSTQIVAELGYKGEFDPWSRSTRIIVYKESILPIEGIGD